MVLSLSHYYMIWFGPLWPGSVWPSMKARIILQDYSCAVVFELLVLKQHFGSPHFDSGSYFCPCGSAAVRFSKLGVDLPLGIR